MEEPNCLLKYTISEFSAWTEPYQGWPWSSPQQQFSRPYPLQPEPFVGRQQSAQSPTIIQIRMPPGGRTPMFNQWEAAFFGALNAGRSVSEANAEADEAIRRSGTGWFF